MRVISRTIIGKFNIMETMSMNWNEMFVCLSRATTAANIGMVYNPKMLYKFAEPPEKGNLLKLEHKLFTGYIYKRTDGAKTYIGSTNDAERREREHDEIAVSKKVEAWYQQMRADIKQITMESFQCMSKKQLVKREYYHIAQIPAELCMNTCGVAVEKTTTKFSAPIEIDYTRFKIKDDPKYKRYRICWQNNVQDFWYKKRAKNEAKAEAEEFRAQLVKEMYI